MSICNIVKNLVTCQCFTVFHLSNERNRKIKNGQNITANQPILTLQAFSTTNRKNMARSSRPSNTIPLLNILSEKYLSMLSWSGKSGIRSLIPRYILPSVVIQMWTHFIIWGCLSCKKKDSPLKIQHPGVLLPHQRHAHGLALEQGGKGGVVRFPV